jgi:hypothetical protein
MSLAMSGSPHLRGGSQHGDPQPVTIKGTSAAQTSKEGPQ